MALARAVQNGLRGLGRRGTSTAARTTGASMDDLAFLSLCLDTSAIFGRTPENMSGGRMRFVDSRVLSPETCNDAPFMNMLSREQTILAEVTEKGKEMFQTPRFAITGFGNVSCEMAEDLRARHIAAKAAAPAPLRQASQAQRCVKAVDQTWEQMYEKLTWG